jgi:hypothetical protein
MGPVFCNINIIASSSRRKARYFSLYDFRYTYYEKRKIFFSNNQLMDEI